MKFHSFIQAYQPEKVTYCFNKLIKIILQNHAKIKNTCKLLQLDSSYKIYDIFI